METAKWFVSGGLALALGALYAQFLTVHPVKMSRYQFGADSALFVSLLLLAVGYRSAELLVVIALVFGLSVSRNRLPVDTIVDSVTKL